MRVTVKNTSGGSLGPFNIYYDAVDSGLLLASNVSSASLAQGVNLTVSDAATSIIVVNTRLGCGSAQQTLQLPPPVVPIDYKDVTVQARLLSATTEPTTASVYYKIDNSPFTLLGNFSGSSCTSFSPVQVPENSTLYLGILSGSNKISFEASGSSFLCSNVASTQNNFCGLDTPYILAGVRGDTTVSMYAETNLGFIINCNAVPPTPPQPLPATTAMRLNVRVDKGPLNNIRISRVLGPTSDFQLYNASNITQPVSQVTIPNVQPGNEIKISVTGQAGNIAYMQVVDLFPNVPQLVYATPNGGVVGTQTYTFTVPTNGSTNYVVNVGSGLLP